MRSAISQQFFIVSCFLIGILSLSDDEFESTTNYGKDTTDHLRLKGRIVNGTKATPGQFPHLVSLRRSYTDSHFCGGNVIADQWILTAAHCMFNSNGAQILPWSLEIVAGQIMLKPNHPLSQRRAVAAIIVHSAFDKDTLTNDVALLRLATPLIIDDNSVRIAELGKKVPTSGTVCQVSGWGYLTEDKAIVSNDMMFVSLPLISPVHCRELLWNVTRLPLGMFCAGYEEGLRDACQGDSGGGMICDKVLSGVVSGGEGCARPTLPGVYADVAYYRNWIKNQMKNFNETAWDIDRWKNAIGQFTHRTNGSTNPRPNFLFLIALVYTLLVHLDASLLKTA